MFSVFLRTRLYCLALHYEYELLLKQAWLNSRFNRYNR